MDSVSIRPGEAKDLAALTAIYNHYVVNTPATFATVALLPADRASWLTDHGSTGRYRLLVAEEDGEILGYASTSQFRPGPAYDTSVEVSIYLAPHAQGQGLGRQLYTALFSAVAEEDIHRAYAVITVPNDASIALHEHFGFRTVGITKEVGRKFGSYWDVAWLEKDLS